ncbi:MAG: M35 family metallo-endopeptidase [Yoonia sp.]|uniref:M35 family metallo-endopeptidase n=1 Tax=Yoonia sp. TaxID=2212373 RepID=UPI0032672199
MIRSAIFLGAALTAFAAAPASAQTFEGCTKAERGIIIAALDRSKRLVLTAATAVGPTPVYTRWFGKFSPRNGDIVRRNLKAVVSAVRTGQVSAACVNHGVGLCDQDTYAFVDPDEHYEVKLCPSFFQMQTMKELDNESAAAGNGTRAGTLIHEITHFTVVAGTDDICYSREVCTDMAIDAPQDALINADSYQYFVEDVTFYGVEGE